MECINAVTQACGPGVSGGLFSNLLGALLAAQCAISPTYHEDVTKNHYEAYDFIVIGAGSSGSAAAAKLAKDSDYQVLLIEAGGDPPQISDIPALFFDLQKTSYDWDYKTEKQKFACGSMNDRKCKNPRGKMLGGCSSINAMMYIRGLEKDYDNWEKLGNKGWGWESVKPHYESQLKRLEIEEYETGKMNTDNSTFVMKEILFEAAKEIGLNKLTSTEDRLHSRIGYFNVLATIKKGTRNNAARQFLGEVKDKKNLHVMKNAHVGRVIIDPSTKKVEGVEVWINEQWKIIKSNKEVILSAGAFNTPQILMLSGVGPKDHLEALGIPVIQNLQVGKNLQDHLVTLGIFHGLHKSTVQEETMQNKLDNLYYYLTQRSGALRTVGTTDIIGFFNVNNMKSTDPNIQAVHFYVPFKSTLLMSMLMTFSGFTEKISETLYKFNNIYDIILQATVLLNPKSRGYVQLKSKDPFEAPIIDPNYFSNPDDMNVVLKGLKHSIKMGETKAMKKHEAKLLDIGISECNNYDVNSDDYLKCIISHTTATLYHPVGTAKMGTGDDAVVDYKLKVKGIKGLRVADASIMPTIISANTNAACMMIGEKAGDIILQDWKNKIEKQEL